MKNQEDKIVIPCSTFYEFVSVRNIIRCEALQNYTRIFIKDKKPILSSQNIGLYIDLLRRYEFVNCHKSHIINRNWISKYFKEGYVEMCDDSHVPVARRRRNEFVDEVVKCLLPQRKEKVIYIKRKELSAKSV